MLYELRREVEATQAQAEAQITLSQEHGFTLREAVAITTRGWALAKQGWAVEGIAQIRHGLGAIQAAGAEQWQPGFLAVLAEAYGEAGQPEEGLTALAEAFDLASKTGCAVNEPRLYLVRGNLLLMQNDLHAAQAASCFQRAIEVARKQNAKSWELRTTISLARLLARRGRRDEACTMLSEIYNWFTEGFETADLKDAKALLDESAREAD